LRPRRRSSREAGSLVRSAKGLSRDLFSWDHAGGRPAKREVSSAPQKVSHETFFHGTTQEVVPRSGKSRPLRKRSLTRPFFMGPRRRSSREAGSLVRSAKGLSRDLFSWDHAGGRPAKREVSSAPQKVSHETFFHGTTQECVFRRKRPAVPIQTDQIIGAKRRWCYKHSRWSLYFKSRVATNRFLIESPLSVMVYALCMSRSIIASARVASPSHSCQCSIGS
jgi:hypothetical protein